MLLQGIGCKVCGETVDTDCRTCNGQGHISKNQVEIANELRSLPERISNLSSPDRELLRRAADLLTSKDNSK
jgi:hypothetical protein